MIKRWIERLRENDALDLPQMSALTLHHLQAAAVCYLLSLLHLFTTITAQDDGWRSATATCFLRLGEEITRCPSLVGGACGFGDLHRTTYGRYSAGLSAILFNKGSTCGACFEVRCVDHSQLCLQGSPTIVLTATDFCPPNYGLPGDHGGWCNFPRSHFQMSQPAFSEIAYRESNIIQIHYRRVKCNRDGGIRFTLNGSAYFMQVLITNVGLDGEIVAVKVKGTRTGWIPMGKNWGQNWQCNIDLTGQPLSFEVTTVSRVTLASYSVAPTNWRFGQTFQGKQF